MRRSRTPRRWSASAWVATGGVCVPLLVGSIPSATTTGDHRPAAFIRPLHAASPAASPPASRTEKTSEATLLTDSDPLTSAVALTAFLRAPVTPATPPGLRYLIERLLLDPNHPAGARAMALRSRGWRVQAFTTPDYTAYQVVGDRYSVDEALRLVRAILSDSPLPGGSAGESLLTQHRQSIALLQGTTTAPAIPLSRLFALSYGDHPGARAVVAGPEQIASYSATAVRDHWTQFYRPSALTVVLSGAIDATLSSSARQQLIDLESQILRTRGRASAALAAGAARTTGKTIAPTHHAGPQVRLLPASELATGLPAVWLGFALDGASANDLAALEVAAQLPQPSGREASLVLGPAQSPALFVLRGPSSNTEPAEGLRAFAEAALQLAESASEDAVARARRRLLLDVARRAETPAGRALRLVALSLSGSDEASWGRRVASLAASDVRRALGRFLVLDRLSVLLRAPVRQGNETPAHSERRLRERLLSLSPRVASSPAAPASHSAAPLKGLDVPSRALVLRSESGAHVVLLPDAASAVAATPRRQLVGFAALWPGGRKREDARLRGLHDLLVRVWPHATSNLPSFALAGLLADLNLSLQAEVSDDALALRGQLPSEGLPQALALLRDSLESPRISESEVERARRDVVLASRRAAAPGTATGSRAPGPSRGASNPDVDAARYAEQLFSHALQADRGPRGDADTGKPLRSPRYEDLSSSVTVLTTRHLQDLLRSYERAPLLLAVVGDFDPGSLTAQLTPWLGGLKPLGELPRTLLPVAAQARVPQPSAGPDASPPANPPAEANGPAQIFAYAATGQAHLVLGARVPGCAAADRGTPLALELLQELLASDAGTGAAQQLLLNRRALAFSVEGALSGCLPERSLTVYAATSPRNLDAAEAGLRDELRRLSDHPAAPEALALARERLASRWVLAGQRRSDRALQLARGLLFGLPDPALSGDSPPELLRRIDAAALQALAKHYLRDEQLVRAAVLPESQRIALSARGVTLRPVEPAPAVADVSSPKQTVKHRGQSDSPLGKRALREPAIGHAPQGSQPAPKQAPKQATKPAGKSQAASATKPHHAAAPAHEGKRHANPASKHAAKLPQRL